MPGTIDVPAEITAGVAVYVPPVFGAADIPQANPATAPAMIREITKILIFLPCFITYSPLLR